VTARLALLLSFSGAAALVLEVAWFRRLAQVAGATSVALAGVLAAVIGGMAVGSLLFGRLADRVHRPVRLYAALEAGVTVCALLSPWWIDMARPVYVALADMPFARFLFAIVHLAPAAVLMGGTLPAVAAALDIAPDRRGRALGWLYSANTLGAVVGTLAAGFVLLPALGLGGTMRVAAIASGVAALGAWLLPRTQRTAPTAALHPVAPADAKRAIRLYAISGFLGMAAEVGFTRGLVLVFGSSTYAFTTALAVFLFGIGAGGALGARLVRENRDALRWLGATVALTGALFSLAAFGMHLLPRFYLEAYLRWGDAFGAGLGVKFALAALVLLPGALGLGVAFPLAARLATEHAAGAGTGRLYGWNTLASIAGSTAAVFLFVPHLGPHYAVSCVAFAAALLAWLHVRRRVALVFVAVAGLGLVPPPDVARERLLVGVYYAPGRYIADGAIDEEAWDDGVDLPVTKYGREATVSLFRWYGPLSVLIDGKAVATSQSVADVQHLELLGHLPMGLRPDARRVLVVGLGLGTTYRAVQAHAPPELVVVEIEGAVGETVAEIGVRPDNLVVEDARLYLQRDGAAFDVITSDPIHPWVRGGGDLYTREYFELCRARLAPGGVMCHWLPLYQMGFEDVRAVVRTFIEVFRTDVYFAGTDLVLLGSAEGEVPRPPPDARMFGEPLAALRVAGHDALVATSEGAAVLLEDELKLEFSTPRHLASAELGTSLRWVRSLWKDPPAPYDALLRAQAAAADGDGATMSEQLERAVKEAPQHVFARRYAGETYLQAAAQYGSAGFLKGAKRLLGDDPRLIGVEADIFANQGRNAEAAALYRQLLETQPDNAYLKRRLARVSR
jgi:spermidine synthase